MAKLKYHESALDLIKLEPVISKENVNLLDMREIELKIKLPASVREWYSLEGSVELMRKYSNDDHPEKIENFEFRKTKMGELIPIMSENQGVCEGFLKLDGSEDPLVLVKVDSDKNHKDMWHVYSNKFSEFIHALIFDNMNKEYPTIISFSSEMMNDADLGCIKSKFIELLVTQGWPSETQLRFHDEEKKQFILVWNKYPCGEKYCSDWFFWGTSKDELFKLINFILECKKSLLDFLDTFKEDGSEVLKKIEKQHPSGH